MVLKKRENGGWLDMGQDLDQINRHGLTVCCGDSLARMECRGPRKPHQIIK